MHECCKVFWEVVLNKWLLGSSDIRAGSTVIDSMVTIYDNIMLYI